MANCIIAKQFATYKRNITHRLNVLIFICKRPVFCNRSGFGDHVPSGLCDIPSALLAPSSMSGVWDGLDKCGSH